MKVCKKVKLLTKDTDGVFVKNDTYKVLRDRAVIAESTIAESEANYKTTGILWVVDKEATKERDELLKPKAQPKETPKEVEPKPTRQTRKPKTK